MNPYHLAALAFSTAAMQLCAQGANNLPSPKNCIIGNVTVAPVMDNALGTNATLFVYAREVNRASGAPVVVVSVKKPRYPQTFKLCPEDQMVPGAAAKPLTGQYRVYARHSLTGVPMTEEGLLGETAGESGAGIRAGASVTIEIDRAIGKSK